MDVFFKFSTNQERVHVIVCRKMQHLPALIHLSNLTSQEKTERMIQKT